MCFVLGDESSPLPDDPLIVVQCHLGEATSVAAELEASLLAVRLARVWARALAPHCHEREVVSAVFPTESSQLSPDVIFQLKAKQIRFLESQMLLE